MVGIRSLFRSHLLLIGILAAVVALFLLFYLQYNSLVTIQTSLPVYRKEMMKKYLREMVKEIDDFYRALAEQSLDVPEKAITNRKGRVIPFNYDWRPVQAAVEQVADHFKKQDLKGVKRYFVVVMIEESETFYGKIAFVYNPVNGMMESATNVPEFNAIHGACAPLMPDIRSDRIIDTKAIGSDLDPEHRIILKPIVDESKKMVAIAGMVIDQSFFKQVYLPEAIRRTLPKYMPAEYKDAAVTVTDQKDQLLFSTEPEKGLAAEVMVPFGFVFTDWRLGIRMGQVTEEQLARRSFFINLFLSIIMTGLLICGVIMVLRAASREMKLSQMKTDFVSNVSHELRTPLASIRIFGEFFKFGLVEDSDKMREYGEYIETESRRLTQLINNILDFSRIESGQKSYQFEQADICEVVTETLKTFEVLLRQSDLKIIFEVQPAPLPPVLIDHDAITQALVNLLDNAVKYSGSEQEIRVLLEQQNNWITISVSDKGVGIPDEEQGKIFERFHRVGNALVHDVKGTGLGLSIVKHIVEAHRGKITVESKVGDGSKFTIYLPVEEN